MSRPNQPERIIQIAPHPGPITADGGEGSDPVVIALTNAGNLFAAQGNVVDYAMNFPYEDRWQRVPLPEPCTPTDDQITATETAHEAGANISRDDAPPSVKAYIEEAAKYMAEHLATHPDSC